ncbi:MAG: F0F1 ATP synthase subunit gamma [Pseudomonadota bacterium]|nr:F0F1 ATP synthase subunit gamma [Pseudomonadota bacterium]
MPSLKDLRNRISSVKSTKKITSAMKMVAAAKLKRAQINAEKTRPYAEKIKRIVNSLTNNINQNTFKFSKKTAKEKGNNILLIVCSADRGLCGGFNSSIIKFTKKFCKDISSKGNNPKFIFVGKKAYNSMKKKHTENILDFFTDFANPSIKFEIATKIRNKALSLFYNDEISECHIIFTRFKSAISQTVENSKLLPLEKSEENFSEETSNLYEYEPNQEHVLNEIIPRNIAIQIHSGLLENLASEQGSRMTAMDNATRNANDMIDNLTLFYNRSRQALITKELIEIISGAEAI